MAGPAGLLTALLLASVHLGGVIGDPGPNQTLPIAEAYYSRPDLDSLVLTIQSKNDSLISPGYIFLAPYQVGQAGPYIFDNDGNLVWSGYGVAGPASSHDFKVCPYNGSDHLCLFQGGQALGYARGHNLIMDSGYNVVKTVQSAGSLPPADQHEFNLGTNGSTAIMSVFHSLPYDLTSENITGGQGWIMEGCFQEVNTETGELLFEWRSLDHVPIDQGWVKPNTTDVSGDGTTKDTPWDYFHINAVDKNDNGDYLVSSRHCSTVYKVSGENGSILWQLGGSASTFEQNNYNFSFQHDVRFVSENATTTVISMFDNAANGYNGTSTFSSGKIIAIDHTKNSSSLVTAYTAPDSRGGLSAASQGNLQFLPNGNTFIGWGSNAYISESTADGTSALYAWFATTGALQYRSYKFNFTSIPYTAPALYTYALNEDANTTFYVSWNGATEVASWNFYSGPSATNLTRVGSAKKAGFETVATQGDFYAYTVAEAVAGNGTALRNSSVTATFIPGAVLAKSCSSIQCPMISGSSISPDVVALSSTPVAPTTSASTDPSTAFTQATKSATPSPTSGAAGPATSPRILAALFAAAGLASWLGLWL